METSFPSYLYFNLIMIVPLIYLHPSSAAQSKQYENCRKPFRCGFLDNISYPFYDGQSRPDYCGFPGFQLKCSKVMPQMSVTSSHTEKFYLLNISPTTYSFTVAREDYWDTYCPSNISNTTINFSLFSYQDANANITLYYECSTTSTKSSNQFSCSNTSSVSSNVYFMTKNLALEYRIDKILQETCKSKVFVPAYQSAVVGVKDAVSLMPALRNGFGLQWVAENELCKDCRGSGGECGQDTRTGSFTCYCPDQPYDHKCNENGFTQNKKARTTEFILLASFLAIGTGMLIVVGFIFKRRYASNNQDIEAFLKTYGSPAPKRYAYGNLKKITNSFKDKLGEGGYGAVYRGKLSNGNLVAVKLLKKSKGKAEEFINEVASIGWTNHVNIVTLLGFCFEGQKRALVYEYMPNGSLEKFIYRRNNNQSLAWEKLLEIAVGIARGLEYLHIGCNTRILHFDIKPHNILLDEALRPKISDFGLAKLCPQKDSIISMSVARGTAGYIAPEVFLKSFGGVSYKSDVYSYGMLILEMVGCRKKDDVKVNNSEEQYFPYWIYKQLEQTEESDSQAISNNEDREIQRKMILVSLWCIQTNPSSRPTITRVVEMLEGDLESVEFPPMQSLSSPPRSQPSSSTTTTISAYDCEQSRQGARTLEESG